MPRGVYVFDIIESKHIQHSWVRAVLGVSRDRYGRLRRGEVLFRHDEVERLVDAMRREYRIGRGRLFAPGAEVLPPQRSRRGRGRPAQGSVARATWQAGAA